MIRKSTNEILIQPKVSPGVRLLTIAIGLLLLGAALYFSFNAGVKSGHERYAQDRDAIAQLNDKIIGLNVELVKSVEELTIAQRHRQIQEEAYKQINAAYAAAEQKNRYLGSRLDFYRSIISPEGGQTGPAIQALTAVQQAGEVSFEVTLVQAIKHKHHVQGSLAVVLYNGEKNVGQWPAASQQNINFQYFQQITGVIKAAQPIENVRMHATLTLLDGTTIERWFEISDSSV